jgi:hypothetical protein
MFDTRNGFLFLKACQPNTLGSIKDKLKTCNIHGLRQAFGLMTAGITENLKAI